LSSPKLRASNIWICPDTIILMLGGRARPMASCLPYVATIRILCTPGADVKLVDGQIPPSGIVPRILRRIPYETKACGRAGDESGPAQRGPASGLNCHCPARETCRACHRRDREQIHPNCRRPALRAPSYKAAAPLRRGSATILACYEGDLPCIRRLNPKTASVTVDRRAHVAVAADTSMNDVHTPSLNSLRRTTKPSRGLSIARSHRQQFELAHEKHGLAADDLERSGQFGLG
jgi:hypothetical protein